MDIDKMTEWLYSFDILSNSSVHNLKRDLFEKQILNKKEVPTFHLKSEPMQCGHAEQSADMKKKVKYSFFNNLYSYFTYVRQCAVVNHSYDGFLSNDDIFNAPIFGEIIGANKQKELKIAFHEYIWDLTRLELVLDKLGYELSSHNHEIIDAKSVTKEYTRQFGKSENVFEKLHDLNTHTCNFLITSMRNVNKKYNLSNVQ
jgi:hypothetical protein